MYVDLKREFEPELAALLLREIKSGHLRNRNKAVALQEERLLTGNRFEIPISQYRYRRQMASNFKEGGAAELFRTNGVKKGTKGI
jgi:hypothetical protein